MNSGIKKAESNIIISSSLATQALSNGRTRSDRPNNHIFSKVHEIDSLEHFGHGRLGLGHKVTSDDRKTLCNDSGCTYAGGHSRKQGVVECWHKISPHETSIPARNLSMAEARICFSRVPSTAIPARS